MSKAKIDEFIHNWWTKQLHGHKTKLLMRSTLIELSKMLAIWILKGKMVKKILLKRNRIETFHGTHHHYLVTQKRITSSIVFLKFDSAMLAYWTVLVQSWKYSTEWSCSDLMLYCIIFHLIPRKDTYITRFLLFGHSLIITSAETRQKKLKMLKIKLCTESLSTKYLNYLIC